MRLIHIPIAAFLITLAALSIYFYAQPKAYVSSSAAAVAASSELILAAAAYREGDRCIFRTDRDIGMYVYNSTGGIVGGKTAGYISEEGVYVELQGCCWYMARCERVYYSWGGEKILVAYVHSRSQVVPGEGGYQQHKG